MRPPTHLKGLGQYARELTNHTHILRLHLHCVLYFLDRKHAISRKVVYFKVIHRYPFIGAFTMIPTLFFVGVPPHASPSPSRHVCCCHIVLSSAPAALERGGDGALSLHTMRQGVFGNTALRIQVLPCRVQRSMFSSIFLFCQA